MIKLKYIIYTKPTKRKRTEDKLQRTASKQKRHNSRKTRRSKRRGGAEEEEDMRAKGEENRRAMEKWRENRDRELRINKEEEDARILRREQRGKMMDTFREDIKRERETEKQDEANIYEWTKKVEVYKTVTLPNEIKVLMKDPVNTNLVTFLNEKLDEDLFSDKYNRISAAIGVIKAIKTKELTNKLAEDIKNYDKEKLKKIFENAIILKLCNLDKAIGQAFIDQGIVKKGMAFGYSIVK